MRPQRGYFRAGSRANASQDGLGILAMMKQVDAERHAHRKLDSVTFACCTCKRLDLFEKSMDNFFTHCLDYDVIDEYIIVDDGSSDADRRRMRERWPNFKFIWKKSSDKGHGHSLNTIQDLATSKWLINWEDDCRFLDRGRWISDAVSVLKSCPEIKQVTFGQSNYSPKQKRDGSTIVSHPIPHRVHDVDLEDCIQSARDFIFYIHPWPGFTNQPHVQALDDVRRVVGRYEIDPSLMDYDFSLRFLKAGFKTAALLGVETEDFSMGRSAYVLNDERRYWDGLWGFKNHLLVAKWFSRRFWSPKCWRDLRAAIEWIRTNG